jgi:hypothetical protein
VSVVYLSDIKKAKERKALSKRDHKERYENFAKVPAHVLAEREAALFQPRDLTAILMGDPPPGRSALDRR